MLALIFQGRLDDAKCARRFPDPAPPRPRPSRRRTRFLSRDPGQNARWLSANALSIMTSPGRPSAGPAPVRNHPLSLEVPPCAVKTAPPCACRSPRWIARAKSAAQPLQPGAAASVSSHHRQRTSLDRRPSLGRQLSSQDRQGSVSLRSKNRGAQPSVRHRRRHSHAAFHAVCRP